MGDKSAIEWTEATWNPIRGCSRVSEGCRNCYAERVAARFSGENQSYEGLAWRTPRPHWSGQVRFIEDALELPLRWKRPRRIFVNSMSDLFHEKVSDVWIDRIFAVMALSPEHTFQVLTKRPERMRAYCKGLGKSFERLKAAAPTGWTLEYQGIPLVRWPIPNVWLGVSVENQETANERIPPLLHTPAAVRWVSYEPALGPVKFGCWLGGDAIPFKDQHGVLGRRLDWIVVGGESGPRARPFELAWARDVIQERNRSVSWSQIEAPPAVFVKQLGAQPFDSDLTASGRSETLKLRDRKGGDMAEWPKDLRVREYPNLPHEAKS